MSFIKKFFLLVILIFLQSCSGGKIGNFFESSFKNVEEPKIKKDIKNNLKNKLVVKSEQNLEEPKIKKDTKNNLKNKLVVKSEQNVEEPKIKKDTKNNLKNKLVVKNEAKSKSQKKINKQNISRPKKQYQAQSYKIIFILKDADPKDPIQDLSTILKNSDVNFEIEKIERYFDVKNKSIKMN